MVICIVHVYKKYLVTSVRVGCATRNLYANSGPKAAGVPITIRGDKDQDPVACEEV